MTKKFAENQALTDIVYNMQACWFWPSHWCTNAGWHLGYSKCNLEAAGARRHCLGESRDKFVPVWLDQGCQHGHGIWEVSSANQHPGEAPVTCYMSRWLFFPVLFRARRLCVAAPRRRYRARSSLKCTEGRNSWNGLSPVNKGVVLVLFLHVVFSKPGMKITLIRRLFGETKSQRKENTEEW